MKTQLACIALGLLACTAPEPTPPAVAGTAANPPAPASRQPPAWATASSIPSALGRWSVHWTSVPSPIPENAPFALEVWVLDNDGELARVELAVDAAMPEHGHGMNRVPQVARTDSGGFAVDGLLFHMPGRWELYFDITHGALTERAQVAVELE